MQAFLPIGDSTLLTEIRSCSGPATVFDSRVICVRHSDSSNITVRTADDGTLLITGDYVPETSDLPNLPYNMRHVK